jgi:hypothetical protein
LLTERLADEFAGKGKILNWSDVWACYAGDNVMQYCFATNEDFLSSHDFKAPLIHALNNSLHLFPYLFYFSWLLPILKSLPESLTKILAPDVVPVLQYEKASRSDYLLYHTLRASTTDLRQGIITQILAIKSGKNQGHKDVSHLTVFKELLESDLPPQEKSVDRLFQDGFTLITAGMETTSYTLQIATCYVLYNPSIFRNVREELMLAIPDPANIPPQAELEKLPYLTAVITEGIYYTCSSSRRLGTESPSGSFKAGTLLTIQQQSGSHMGTSFVSPEPSLTGPFNTAPTLFHPQPRSP